MANLTKAHEELFRRSPDECFSSLEQLVAHCRHQKEAARDLWHPPQNLVPTVSDNVTLNVGDDGAFALNHWSFSQLCSLCGVSKDTLNRLTPDTASRALTETLPHGTKPMQVHVSDDLVRSIHGVNYSRLWNADLLAAVCDAATDFEPPPKGMNGGTGLYCGEQDLFAFLIDPAGWTEIGGEAFAPGFFVFNSEVGKRSVGVQTFWFQSICQNHIVWDAHVEGEFKRKHTGNVGESLDEIRRIIGDLTAKRDDRRDGFAAVIKKAMGNHVAQDGDEAVAFLLKHGITRTLAKKAVAQLSADRQAFTLWSFVDALTRITATIRYAGDRTDADHKVSKLLELAV